MTAKVYSYIRFSDAKQAAGASSERQGAYADQWAKEHGLKLDTELSMRDEGLSAFHQKHIKKGALGVFLLAVEDGKVPTGSVLVVEGLDRLSRAEPIQAQAQLASIINAGISVVTASDGKVYSRERLKANPMDLVYSLLVMIRAHEESDTKSKRVRDAIRRQCKGWVDGTFRGMVKIGNTPSWMRVADGKWEFIQERADAVKLAVELFLRGFGASKIAQELHARGLAPSDRLPESGHLTRIMAHPAIVGEKHVEMEADTFVLRDYYPPVVTREVWDELQEQVQLRGRKNVKGGIPSVLTGHGVAFCGYCGSPMKAQMMVNRRRADGTIPSADRRLQCVKVNIGGGCNVKGSCSSAHIEQALMNYCSDMMNLQALHQGDAAAAPRGEVSAAKAKLTDIDVKLERLTAVMLDTDGPIPLTFARKARELEVEREMAAARLRTAERALTEAVRADITGADQEWGTLAASVEAMNYESRMQARQLVADTFEKIVIYAKGRRPGSIPRGSSEVILIAKGGTARALQVEKTGKWAVKFDYTPQSTPRPMRKAQAANQS